MSVKSFEINFDLTLDEAKSLLITLGYFSTYPDVVESCFPHPHGSETRAFNALDKLRRSLREIIEMEQPGVLKKPNTQ